MDENDAIKGKVDDISFILKQYEKSDDLTIAAATAYLKQWQYFDMIGGTTTCVYQYVGYNTLEDDDEVVSYFCCDGIGMAFPIISHVAQCFFAHVFSHCTPLTIVIKNRDGKRFVAYELSDFNIFAWGKGRKDDN